MNKLENSEFKAPTKEITRCLRSYVPPEIQSSTAFERLALACTGSSPIGARDCTTKGAPNENYCATCNGS